MTRPPSRRGGSAQGKVQWETLDIVPSGPIQQWTPITYDEALSGVMPSKVEIERRVAEHEAQK